ncbi:nucleotide pyrophosphohydrolase [Isoptericola sp. QY 916]|uniref:nucleotide pyrophosphohydrolase n=1 Tax=Isoptericola sp. QY 916 TaxID=2782570 RepID=UPI003D2FB821
MDELKDLASRLREFAAERDWQQFHTPRNLAMALAGEVGELLAELQWSTDQEVGKAMRHDPDYRGRVESEMADVFSYLVRLADVMNVDLIHAALQKIDENETRYPRDLSRGNATKYTKLRPDQGAVE